MNFTHKKFSMRDAQIFIKPQKTDHSAMSAISDKHYRKNTL